MKDGKIKYEFLPSFEFPQEWKLLSLNDVGKFSKGKGILKDEVIPNGLPCIRYGEIYTRHEYLIKKFYSFISEETAKVSQPIKKNVILFTGSGETLEDIGKAVAYIGEEVAYAGGDIIILSVGVNVDPVYLSYLLNSDFVNWQKRRFGQGHSVVHIYSSDLATLKVPIAPLHEQYKIAAILSSCDKVIEAIENLIKGKERHKKALMQQLLAGKKRFKEFKGEKWKKVFISDLCKIKYGKDHKLINDIKGKFPIIGTGGVMGFTDSFLCDKPSVLIGRKGTIDRPLYIETPFWTIDTAYYTEFPDDVHAKWFYYCFSQIPIFKYNEASGVPSLSRETLYKIKIKTPSFDEQKKIASVISTDDEEIQTLKIYLEHCRQQKKGLMQVLLTGKKRVKI